MTQKPHLWAVVRNVFLSKNRSEYCNEIGHYVGPGLGPISLKPDKSKNIRLKQFTLLLCLAKRKNDLESGSGLFTKNMANNPQCIRLLFQYHASGKSQIIRPNRKYV